MEQKPFLETMWRLSQDLGRLSGRALDEHSRANSGKMPYPHSTERLNSFNQNANVVNFGRLRADLSKATESIVDRRDEIEFEMPPQHSYKESHLEAQNRLKFFAPIDKVSGETKSNIGTESVVGNGENESNIISLRISSTFINLASEYINRRIKDNFAKCDPLDKFKFKHNCRINDAISHNVSRVKSSMRANKKDGISIIINIISIIEILFEENDLYLFEDTIESLSYITSQIVTIDGFDIISAERVDSLRGAEVIVPVRTAAVSVRTAAVPVRTAAWLQLIENFIIKIRRSLFLYMRSFVGFFLIVAITAALVAISMKVLETVGSKNLNQQSFDGNNVIVNNKDRLVSDLGEKAFFSNSIEEINSILLKLLPLAESGNRDAQFFSGLIYDAGHVDIRNSVKAEKWYAMAEAGGLLNAGYNKVIMLYAGSPSQLQAVRSDFLRLARSGLAAAQRNLGIMLATGQGGTVDKVQAFAWLSFAEMAGDEMAKPLRVELESQMTPNEISNSKSMLQGGIVR